MQDFFLPPQEHSIQHSTNQLRRNLFMPLSPQGSTTAIHSSFGFSAWAFKIYSQSRTMLLGSWWGCLDITPCPSFPTLVACLLQNLSPLTSVPLHTSKNSWLLKLLTVISGPATLTSTVPRTKLRTMEARAFYSAAPCLWNSLPDHPRAQKTAEAFKKGPKSPFI